MEPIRYPYEVFVLVGEVECEFTNILGVYTSEEEAEKNVANIELTYYDEIHIYRYGLDETLYREELSPNKAGKTAPSREFWPNRKSNKDDNRS